MEKHNIRAMTEADWPEVSSIYAQGMQTGNATFQQQVPDWAQWNHGHLPDLRYVADCGAGKLLGWVAVSPYSARPVYRGVVEISVYVAADARATGIGGALLAHLISESERLDYWTLYAGIFPENTASIRLHESCGFRLVGRRERLGRLNGIWRDVCLYERRSAVAGMTPAEPATAQ